MEDIPTLIFALLFLLVIILILLHRSNKKFADKISILEQTVELKAESLSSMKEIYAESKKVLAKSKEQQEDIEAKKKVIFGLEETKIKLKNIIDEQKEEKEQLKKSHEAVIEKVTEKIVALEYNAAKNESIANELKVKHKEIVQKAENNRHMFEQTIEEKNSAMETLKVKFQNALNAKEEEKEVLEQEIHEKENYIIKIEDTHKEKEKQNTQELAILVEVLEKKETLLKEKTEAYDNLEVKFKEAEIENLSALDEQNMIHQNILEKQHNTIASLEKTVNEKAKEITVLTETQQAVEYQYNEDKKLFETSLKNEKEAMKTLEENHLKVLEEFKNKNHLKEQAFQAKENEIDRLKKVHDETLFKEKKLRVNTETKLKEYEEKIKEFNEEKILLDEKITRLQKTISDTGRKMLELNIINDTTVKENKEKIFSLEQSLEAKKEIIANLEVKNEESLKEKTEIVMQYEKRNKEAMHENTKLLRKLEETIQTKDKKITLLELSYKEMHLKTEKDLLALEEALKLEKESVEEELNKIVTKNDEILKQLKYDNVTNERKYEERIVSLKKDIEIKENMIKKLQDDHKASREDYHKETRTQKEKKQTLHEEIKHLKEKDHQTQIAFEKEIQILEDVVEHQDKSISELEFSQKDKENETNKMDVMHYISEGQSKESVAKQFGIPVKMVDLIIKFDKIKKEK